MYASFYKTFKETRGSFLLLSASFVPFAKLCADYIKNDKAKNDDFGEN